MVERCKCSWCRLNESLAENKDLSARLIDQALQNEEDMFDAAFGETQTPAARAPPREAKPTAVERRQAELAEQVCIPDMGGFSCVAFGTMFSARLPSCTDCLTFLLCR